MATSLRCAIYTRKSSEDGLEQSFNSLHAQREACDAYVRSQAGEGWVELKQAYDDGGFSGGSMDRPGLRQLLADIDAGKVDVVVVYKVDRLTRSLADFAKIVEAFDARGVSFVSVTQAFNTTTSMGRLTLNVLLSFAQFEREVTGERIRDKIAASKAKGIWMGGMVPLGYDLADRALVVNSAEAATVRRIFQRYLEVESARDLVTELRAEGIRSKRWVTRKGEAMGGCPLARGAVYHILKSRLYLGEIVHRDAVHPGRHPAIVSPELFALVAAKLEAGATRRRERPVRAASALLVGRLFDENGEAMTPSFSYGRGGTPYRYYVATQSQPQLAGDRDKISRVPGAAVEAFLFAELQRLSGTENLNRADLGRCLRRVELRSSEVHLLVSVPDVFGDDHIDLALSSVRRRLTCDDQAVPEGADSIRIVLQRRLQLRGGRRRIVDFEDVTVKRKSNPAIVAALKRGHQDLLALSASPFTPRDRLRGANAPPSQHGRQIAKLAFLAPALQRQILEGEQPATLTLGALLKGAIPLAWEDQNSWFKALPARSK